MLDIGKQGLVVADDFELDPIGVQRLTCQLRRKHSVASCVAAGSVGQDVVAPTQEIKNTLAARVEANTAHSNGHDLRTTGLDGVQHHLLVWVAGGANEQAGREGFACDRQLIRHH